MLTPVVMVGGPFGVMRVDADETVAFAGHVRYVRVEYEISEDEDDSEDPP